MRPYGSLCSYSAHASIARYHVHCGTARFALSCGLHRINSNELQEAQDDHSTSNIGYLLSPPETEVELGDRLNAFWQIYWSDKLLSTLMGFIAALPGQAEPPDGISSVFPREIEYYEVIYSTKPSKDSI